MGAQNLTSPSPKRKMKSILIYNIILVIVIDLSVNGHPSPDRQNEQLYEYYYYDDDYYYNDELTGSRNTERPAATTSTQSTVKPTDNQPDSLSEAKEAIAQYDFDELVKAWREYMEEKEHKENQRKEPSSSSNLPTPTGRRRPVEETGRRRPGNRHRLRPTGQRQGVNNQGF